MFGLLACGMLLVATLVHPSKAAAADICTPNGRDCFYGYFFNGYDGGPSVRQHNLLTAPALLNVNNGWDLVHTILADLNGCPGGNLPNPNGQNETGAAFIVLTMLGLPPGTNKNVACQRFDEWSGNVYNLEASGLIDFSQVYNFGGINTRSTKTDVAYYPDAGAADSIVFYNPANPSQPTYAIKKDCGNPLGRLLAAQVTWNLTPTVQSKVNGVVSDTAETNDTITFTFNISNSSLTDSHVVNCNAAAINHVGYFKTPASPEAGGSNVATSCPRAFGRKATTTVATQTVTATANTTLCRTLFVNPAFPGGGTRSYEKCVTVVSKPYLSVFGGDVSAGGDVESSPGTCTTNASASIVSWNKNTAGYAGAGIQYAALATGTIKEFTTAQNSPAGGAGMPGGLSFSSTTQTSPGGNKYGGDFGAAKCIKNYYAQKPATTTPMPSDVSSMVSGSYAAASGATLGGGNVNPGQKTTVFVDGDLYITGDITYTGSWSYNNIPLFELVVRGNIYIDHNVTRLDGVYIAQPWADLSHGYVYTCTTGAAAPTLTAGAFYNSCTNKLTVNGSIVSRSIQFLRTSGTLRNANVGDDKSTTKAAEVFNYGPGFWITQPNLTSTTGGETDNYDSITSLPPVL